MIRFAVLSTILLSSALRAQTTGTNGERYEIRVATSKAAAYGAVIATLTDSSFTMKETSQDAGIVKTEWRKPMEVASKGFKSFFKAAFSNPIRLNVVIVPLSADSTRIVITGEENQEQIDRVAKLNEGYKGEWKFVTSIGVAIRNALSVKQPPDTTHSER